jgi:hypothetical protein
MRGTYPATLPDVKVLELFLYFPHPPNETSSYGVPDLTLWGFKRSLCAHPQGINRTRKNPRIRSESRIPLYT